MKIDSETHSIRESLFVVLGEETEDQYEHRSVFLGEYEDENDQAYVDVLHFIQRDINGSYMLGRDPLPAYRKMLGDDFQIQLHQLDGEVASLAQLILQHDIVFVADFFNCKEYVTFSRKNQKPKDRRRLFAYNNNAVMIDTYPDDPSSAVMTTALKNAYKDVEASSLCW